MRILLSTMIPIRQTKNLNKLYYFDYYSKRRREGYAFQEAPNFVENRLKCSWVHIGKVARKELTPSPNFQLIQMGSLFCLHFSIPE